MRRDAIRGATQRSARAFALRRTLIVLSVLAAFGLAFAMTPPSGPRSLRQFDADRVASLETRMWQAYYRKERARLFGLLVSLLHEQYRFSWAAATVEGYHLARAAAAFGDSKNGHEVVLPDLEVAFERVRSWTGAGFDPRAAARAELAWWEARRNPGRNSPEQVGRLMADAYALVYESSPSAMAAPALLRAQAAALRDARADSPDWATIGQLLQQSYRELRLALATSNV